MTDYFKSKGIKPNDPDPTLRLVQIANAQLNLQDSYYSKLKEDQITALSKMGVDKDQARAFLDNVGCPVNDSVLIKTKIVLKEAVNPLRLCC